MTATTSSSSGLRAVGASVVAAALLIGCQSATPPPPPQVHRLQTGGIARRVILASFDGLGADELATYGAPAFTSMPARVGRVIPVTPTATAVTHTSILTGATPQKSGVVANLFHKPGTPVTETARGLDTDIDVETLLDAVHRAGKRVGSIVFPTVDGRTPRRTADFGVYWSERETEPRFVKLRRTDFRSDWLPPTWGSRQPPHPSFSPIVRARLAWEHPQLGKMDVDLVAYDSTDDQKRDYDQFFVEYDGREVAVDQQRWFTVTKKTDAALYGSWSKIISFDPALGAMTVYWGGITRTHAAPESFQQMLDNEAGFWPGKPDEPNARRWLAGEEGLDPMSFVEQNAHLSSFITSATTVAMRHVPFDLLLTYQPVIDEVEHTYRIELPAQLHYSADNRAAGDRARAATFAMFDQSVAQLTKAIDPAHDALIVTGDHGLAPADTEVGVNRLLAGWGMATLQGSSLAPDTQWAGYATGNVAMFYRFAGTISEESLVSRLTALRTPDGEPVFEVVSRKTSTSHPNSGDVMALAYPHFALSSMAPQAFASTMNYGQHGGFNGHHEFHTTLGATGAAIVTQSIATMPQTAIAAWVSSLLGIEPPRNAER